MQPLKSAGALQATLNSLSYAIMWRYAERQMAIGTPIIVDCPLARRELFDQGRAIAAKVLYPIIMPAVQVSKTSWNASGL